MRLISSTYRYALALTPPVLRRVLPWFANYLAAALAPAKAWADRVFDPLYAYVQRNKGRGPYRMAIVRALDETFSPGFRMEFDDSYQPEQYLRFFSENRDTGFIRFSSEGYPDEPIRFFMEDTVPFDFNIYVPDNIPGDTNAMAAIVNEYREPGSRYRIYRDGDVYEFPQ